MSDYVIRWTSKWGDTVTHNTTIETNNMEEAIMLMVSYAEEEQRLIESDWCSMTGYSIKVIEKWYDGTEMTIAEKNGGNYE